PSSARYFMLHLEGKPFRIIGTDGGLLEKPVDATRVLITPGERVDILAGPFHENDNFYIESLAYNRMTFKKSKQESFARAIVGSEKPSVVSIPEVFKKIEPLAEANAPVNRKVKLSVGASLKHGIDFIVNNDMQVN